MKFVKLIFTTVFCGAILFGCGSTPAKMEAPTTYQAPAQQYKIGVGDSLAINVWRNPELTLEVPVRPDGKISMPLVGEASAAGISASDLSDNLQQALSGYIRNPQVTVIVLNPASTDYQSRVRVTGSVENPISVPYRSGMTVLDLVLEAGGTTEFAIANNAKLFRKTASGVETYIIRLGNILNKGELSTNYPLAPSDIITVPERSF